MDSATTNWRVILAVIVLCSLGCGQSPQRPNDSNVATDMTVDAPELDLDYKGFDQSPGQGWRQVAEEGNHVAAAALIESYLKRKNNLEEWQRANLRFHAGQLYAFADDATKALSHFEASISPNEPTESPVRWNAYVNATIAFLKKDRERLIKMRDEIAQGPKLQGSVPNLDVVDRLIRNFDQPYSIAYRGRADESDN